MAVKAAKKATVPAARTSPSEERTTKREKSSVDRTIDLSQDLLKSVEAGQRAAIEAVRKFVETVDEALPALGGHPSRREAILDAALELADKLVTTQYEFLRSVVRTAGRSLDKVDK
jgi:hypothetical protein